ncbi:hypothetical protein V6N11_039048 [Hibiscus sabdariffa]|uniref:Uncharacterized protein n=1 Tax=Hibiscus sabdariffa TaxID=183260 RepID=A0ABR2SLT5_9ROSI
MQKQQTRGEATVRACVTDRNRESDQTISQFLEGYNELKVPERVIGANHHPNSLMESSGRESVGSVSGKSDPKHDSEDSQSQEPIHHPEVRDRAVAKTPRYVGKKLVPYTSK